MNNRRPKCPCCGTRSGCFRDRVYDHVHCAECNDDGKNCRLKSGQPVTIGSWPKKEEQDDPVDG